MSVVLPANPAPIGGIYKPAVITQKYPTYTLYASGAIPWTVDASAEPDPMKRVAYQGPISGKPEEDRARGLTVQSEAEGEKAAKLAAGYLIRSIEDTCQNNDLQVVQVLKLTGYVNSTDTFYMQPKVMNAASELFKEKYGEDRGVGARTAIGTSHLPLNATFEIDAVVSVQKKNVSPSSRKLTWQVFA